jgi:hypothetical protein
VTDKRIQIIGGMITGGVKFKHIQLHAGYPDRLGPSGKFVENSIKHLALKLPVI